MFGIRRSELMIVITMVVFLLCTSSQFIGATELEREHSEAGKMVHKFSRGVMNVLTGWLEVPYNIAETWKKTDPFTGFVVGGIKGIFWGWGRTCTGVYDIVTFPFPVPKDYQPLMEPEYILPEIWGEPFPHYAE